MIRFRLILKLLTIIGGHVLRILVTFMLCFMLPAHAQYESRIVAEGFAFPWSMAFVDDQTALVATRNGSLHRIDIESGKHTPITGGPETYVESQGGYFDLLLDPNFSQNQTLYLALAEGPPEANATAIYRAILADGALTRVTRIFRVEPAKDTAAHYGGKLAFFTDGTLLLTSGDGFEYREASQDPYSQLGKILRMNPDGSPAADNPFIDGNQGDPYVYSYGHRSPQGLAVDAAGQIWMHEHGPQGGDELNLVRPGANYGWPATSFGINYSGAKITPLTSAEGINPPVTYWTPSIAPSHLMIYSRSLFPEWTDSLFVSTLVDNDVKRLVINDETIVSEDVLFAEFEARIRAIVEGPQGQLYLLTDSETGQIIEIVPSVQDDSSEMDNPRVSE